MSGVAHSIPLEIRFLSANHDEINYSGPMLQRGGSACVYTRAIAQSGSWL